jgi:hypothetical protein
MMETPLPVEEEQPPDPERAAELKHRYKAARRAGMTVRDSQLFAAGDTTVEILLLCVRRGATLEQLLDVCL